MKLRVRHVKCILSFREEETKVKIQMFDLFHRKADVYKRQLQVRMGISAINSPTPQRLVCGASSGLRGCRRWRSSKIGGQIQTLNTTFLTCTLPNSGSCSGHYFTWETCIFRRIYSSKQRYRVVRPLVKANTCKNLYQLDIGILHFTISFMDKDAQLITLIIIVN